MRAQIRIQEIIDFTPVYIVKLDGASRLFEPLYYELVGSYLDVVRRAFPLREVLRAVVSQEYHDLMDVELTKKKCLDPFQKIRGGQIIGNIARKTDHAAAVFIYVPAGKSFHRAADPLFKGPD